MPIQDIGSDQAIVDGNSQVMRLAVAILTKRNGGRLTIRPEELAELMEMVESGGADLTFHFDDAGAVTFNLTQAEQKPGLRLS